MLSEKGAKMWQKMVTAFLNPVPFLSFLFLFFLLLCSFLQLEKRKKSNEIQHLSDWGLTCRPTQVPLKQQASIVTT